MKKVKILALISAIIVAVLLYNFLTSISKPVNVEVTKTAVIIASIDIIPNTIITEDMLKTIDLPVEAVHADAIDETNLAIGKVSSSEIMIGEQILSTKLISVDGDSGNGTLAYEIKKGTRAITIGVGNLSGLSGMIKPKNTVDVIAQFEKVDSQAEGDDKTKYYTTMLAENITVLAVDNVLSQDGKTLNEDGVAYTSVTLQVTPMQAMKISLSEYKGQLRLILRSPLDDGITSLPSILYDDIIIN
ncbi:pilus assembly protein CpaB [Sedimentibacter acidaminivorans]|uniref:Pilus assembly protein CpaB n=1 Tax=Sedimentibacter acidaminivorans TaxID=913099 RepID=A0ABS4GAV7_9FIRM|nr:Flp pilus assembly protein CpaB [Sedimentibacter acidaminivorans]MBP1924811.1 pilus assembly protein CpaB [Sedimentibacter acidaminivorans]